jgi:hypothetical protein
MCLVSTHEESLLVDCAGKVFIWSLVTNFASRIRQFNADNAFGPNSELDWFSSDPHNHLMLLDLRFSQQWLKSSVIWIIMLCSLVKVNWCGVSQTRKQHGCWLLYAAFLHVLLFDHKDGGGMFLWSFYWVWPDCTRLYPRKQNSSYKKKLLGLLFCHNSSRELVLIFKSFGLFLKLKCLTCWIIFTFTVKVSIPGFIGNNFCYAICYHFFISGIWCQYRPLSFQL